MYRLFTVVIALLLTSSARGAIIVGHPVPFHFAGGTGVINDSGAISVTDEVVTFANNTTLTIPVNAVLRPGDTILLPEGQIVEVALRLGAPITVSGHGTNGGTYALALDAGTIVIDVDPPLTVSAQGTSNADSLELAFPNWITASSLQLAPNTQRYVAYGHPLHATLRGDVLYDSAVLR